MHSQYNIRQIILLSSAFTANITTRKQIQNCTEYKENATSKIRIRSNKKDIKISLNEKNVATSAVDLIRSTKYSYKREKNI